MLVDEDASDIAIELWGVADSKVTSQLAYPEARAALAAAARGNRLSEDALDAAIHDLDRALEATLLIGVDRELARAAGALAHTHALRGYDAVHLATALTITDPGLVVVTWDRDLSSAAFAAGCSVAPALR